MPFSTTTNNAFRLNKETEDISNCVMIVIVNINNVNITVCFMSEKCIPKCSVIKFRYDTLFITIIKPEECEIRFKKKKEADS